MTLAPGGALSRGRLNRAAAAAMCANLVGIGLSRFAYAPLIPALIGAGWLNPGGAAYLGAANLAGYLAGALTAAPIARRWAAVWVMRWMMVAIGVSFIACGFRPAFPLFFAWRFIAGFAGAVMMTLAGPSVLAYTPPARRGRIAGVILTGVGIGVLAAGSLVPVLLANGLVATWFGIGFLALALAALCWFAWLPLPVAAARPAARRPAEAWLLALQYGLCAMGLVPHGVFLVDFIARGLGRGMATGAAFFLVYGVGALVGPMITGLVSDRIGVRRTLTWALPVAALAVLLPVVSSHVLVLGLSAVLAGGYTLSIVAMVLGRSQEIAQGDPERHRAIWGVATMSFAMFQAAAAYGMAYLYAARGGAYDLLFIAGGAALVLAALVGWLPAMRRS